MANKVLLEVEVTGKGIKVVQKDLEKTAASTNKAAEATDKLTRSRNAYNKGEKGVAAAGANSTKNFSKMRGVIDGGGSSGLVAAYATLAANLFAASAAFNALRNASKVEQLVQGLETIGTVSGRNLSVLASGLQEVTDYAISTEQALRSTALATSAGFSDAQLKNLGTIAKGASIALGRDLTDALDRLVRGTAKLEPEILDELGIFVRIDDAVANYASAVGKTVGEVTEFERRQAFLNETIAKGTERFAEIAGSSEANPYDKVAAALNNLSKEFLKLINVAVVPVIDLFSKNQAALSGAVILFASTISRQMLPALANSSKALAENAQEAAENAKAQAKNLVKQKEGLKVYNQLIDRIEDGTATQADFRSGLNSLDGSLATTNKRLTEAKKNFGAESTQYKAVEADIRRVTLARQDLLRVMSTQAVANAKERAALGISQLQSGSLILAYKSLTGAVVDYSRALTLSNVTGSTSIAVMNGIKVAGFAAATGLRALASGFFALLGPIGLILSFGPLIYDWFKNKFYPDDTNKKAEELIKNLESITETTGYYANALDKGIFEAGRFASAISGTIQTASDAIQEAYIADVQAAELRAQKILALEEEIRTRRAAGEKEGLKSKNARGKGGRSALGKAVDELDALRSANNSYAEEFQTTIQVAQAAVQRLQAQSNLGITFINPIQLALVKKAQEEFTKGSISYEQFQAVLTAARAPAENFKSSLQGITDEGKKYRDEVNKLSAKTATPFDNLLEATQGVEKNYRLGKKAAAELYTEGDRLQRRQQSEKQLREELNKLGFKGSIEDLKEFNEGLAKSLERQRELPGEIKEAEAQYKKLSFVRNADANLLEAQLKAEEDINSKRQELVNERITTLETLEKKGVISNAQAKEYNTLLGERAQLENEALKFSTTSEQVNLQRLEDTKKIFELESKIFSSKKEQLNAELESRQVAREIARLKSGAGEFSAAAQLAIFEKEKAGRLELLKQEFDQKLAGIALEYQLLNAKLTLLEAQYKGTEHELTNANQIRGLYLEGAIAAQNAAQAQYNLSVKRIDLEEAQRQRAVKDAGTALSTSLQGSDGPAAMIAAIRKAQADRATTEEALATPTVDNNGDGNVDATDNKGALARAKIQEAQAVMAPFIAQLEKLGPEGMLVSAIAQSSLVIADSFTTIGEKGLASAEGLAAVGAVMSSIASIANAASDAKIAGIDKEIEAEKKRDGKSKESLAKIQALEAKKEKQKRKQFEMNKKMMIAQTIINTAAGVMATMRDGGFFASPLAMIVAAMGAAQLAIIAGTSYQGGGSVSKPSAPSELSVGERSNKVDVAKPATGQELAGLRGGDTANVGGQSMQPPGAFMGAKYRAQGGATTGYIVGEQGPELFVPETPGRIVPNDEMRQSQPLNVNFTVQAIDASSFNDALVTQRGNIIGMIREAANTYGETFLEGVNDVAISAGGGKI